MGADFAINNIFLLKYDDYFCPHHTLKWGLYMYGNFQNNNRDLTSTGPLTQWVLWELTSSGFL